MPQIAEYNAPDTGIRVDTAGANALSNAAAHTVQAGRTIRGLADQSAAAQRQEGQTLGRAVTQAGGVLQDAYDKHVQQTEKNDLELKFAQKYNSDHDDYVQGLTSAKDPTAYRQQFLQKQLDSYSQTIAEAQTDQGRQVATQLRTQYFKQWMTASSADLGTIQSERAKQGAVQYINIQTDNARKDPSSIDMLLQQADAKLASDKTGLHGMGVSETKQLDDYYANSKKSIVNAGLDTLAQQSPSKFREMVASGKFDKYVPILGNDGLDTLKRSADVYEKTQQMAEKTALSEEDKANKKAGQEALTDTFTKYVKYADDGSVSVDPKAFGQTISLANKLPPGAISAEQLHAQLGALHTLAGQEGRVSTNPAIYTDLRSRIFLDPEDPQKATITDVDQAMADHQLSPKDYQFFRNVAKDGGAEVKMDEKAFQKFLAAYKPAIDQSTMLDVKPLGQVNYYRFTQDMTDEFYAARQKGISVRDLLNPRGAHFLLSDPKILPTYQASGLEALDFTLQKAQGKGIQIPGAKPPLGQHPSGSAIGTFVGAGAPIRYKPGQDMD